MQQSFHDDDAFVLYDSQTLDTLFSIRCGAATVASWIAYNLALHNFRPTPGVALTLLVDLPTGFALNALEQRLERAERSLVVTWNPCADYWEDLWELEPAGLISGGLVWELPAQDQPRNRSWQLESQQLVSGGLRTQDLVEAFRRVERGEQIWFRNGGSSVLTARQRRLLRMIARGWETAEIAEQLQINQQSVLNALTRIYERLGLRNRTEAALYYWGLWPVLPLR